MSFDVYERVYAQPKNLPQIAYMQINKSGCCSILTALYDMANPNVDECSNFDVYSQFHDQISFNKLKYEEIKNKIDVFKFTFIRNPIDRFIDFYFDKIYDRSDIPEWVTKFGVKQGADFQEIVDLLQYIPEKYYDSHFMPQYNLIFQNGQMGVDFIGKLEQADLHWAVIKNFLGIDINLPHLHIVLSQYEIDEFKKNLSKKIIYQLRKFYIKDLEYFGYEEPLS